MGDMDLLNLCHCGHYAYVHALESMTDVCTAMTCPCMHFDPEPSVGLGYHLADIPKGEIGEASKIEEEFWEFQDALTQGAVVMQLCELSDMLGAIDAWLAKHHPSVKIEDLLKMSDMTRRAFSSGRRK